MATRVPAWLAHLEDEDYQFIKRFLLASGSLKELAAAYRVSYPTIRLQVDRLISHIKGLDDRPPADASHGANHSPALRLMPRAYVTSSTRSC